MLTDSNLITMSSQRRKGPTSLTVFSANSGRFTHFGYFCANTQILDMIVFPNAKVNLGLQIVSKRPDGYHEIRSCMYPIPLHDALEIQPAAATEFNSTGFTIPGSSVDNLILKAYHLLKADFPNLPPISAHLHKTIPIGAGLGGGSADASFALVAINRLFSLFLDNETLEEYAAKLGSDCPFFIQNTPKLVSGRGEIMKDVAVSLKDKWLLLIYPGIHVSTQKAYAGVNPKPASNHLEDILRTPSSWKEALVNDFEESLFPQFPVLATLKTALYDAGAIYAAMSGSGSTMFGIFEHKPQVEELDKHYFVYHAQL